MMEIINFYFLVSHLADHTRNIFSQGKRRREQKRKGERERDTGYPIPNHAFPYYNQSLFCFDMKSIKSKGTEQVKK